MAKTIKELDYYDLLSLRIDASPVEIEGAYLLAVATYQQDSPASRGLLAPAERELILDKIEEAFVTLRDPEKKKTYDALIGPERPEFRQRAYFRNSTRKLDIEDAPAGPGFWERIRSALVPSLRRPKNGAGGEKEDGKSRVELLRGGLYYGEYFRRLRESRGLTLLEAADGTGIDPGVLQSLEDDDRRKPRRPKGRRKLLRRYAVWLGLDSENGRK